MDTINLTEYYYNWFKNYINNFYGENEKLNNEIKLRELHSLKVVSNVKEIAELVIVNKDLISLAELAALFHDIGRFEQFKIYGTFDDKISIDHAELGVNILRENKVLDNLPARDKELILSAVFYHNKKGIHLKCNDPKLIQLTDLLRKADKLDLLKPDKNSTLNDQSD